MNEIDELNYELNQEKEKYKLLESQIEKQKPILAKFKERKELNDPVNRIKFEHADLTLKMQKLKEEKDYQIKRLQNESEKNTEEIQRKIIEVQKSRDEAEQYYKLLCTKYDIMYDKWNKRENTYLKDIDQSNQKFLMVQAKLQEVNQRLLRLRDSHHKTFNDNTRNSSKNSSMDFLPLNLPKFLNNEIMGMNNNNDDTNNNSEMPEFNDNKNSLFENLGTNEDLKYSLANLGNDIENHHKLMLNNNFGLKFKFPTDSFTENTNDFGFLNQLKDFKKSVNTANQLSDSRMKLIAGLEDIKNQAQKTVEELDFYQRNPIKNIPSDIMLQNGFDFKIDDPLDDIDYHTDYDFEEESEEESEDTHNDIFLNFLKDPNFPICQTTQEIKEQLKELENECRALEKEKTMLQEQLKQ